jgi:hypothetical protein
MTLICHIFGIFVFLAMLVEDVLAVDGRNDNRLAAGLVVAASYTLGAIVDAVGNQIMGSDQEKPSTGQSADNNCTHQSTDKSHKKQKKEVPSGCRFKVGQIVVNADPNGLSRVKPDDVPNEANHDRVLKVKEVRKVETSWICKCTSIVPGADPNKTYSVDQCHLHPMHEPVQKRLQESMTITIERLGRQNDKNPRTITSTLREDEERSFGIIRSAIETQGLAIGMILNDANSRNQNDQHKRLLSICSINNLNVHCQAHCTGNMPFVYIPPKEVSEYVRFDNDEMTLAVTMQSKVFKVPHVFHIGRPNENGSVQWVSSQSLHHETKPAPSKPARAEKGVEARFSEKGQAVYIKTREVVSISKVHVDNEDLTSEIIAEKCVSYGVTQITDEDVVIDPAAPAAALTTPKNTTKKQRSHKPGSPVQKPPPRVAEILNHHQQGFNLHSQPSRICYNKASCKWIQWDDVETSGRCYLQGCVLYIVDFDNRTHLCYTFESPDKAKAYLEKNYAPDNGIVIALDGLGDSMKEEMKSLQFELNQTGNTTPLIADNEVDTRDIGDEKHPCYQQKGAFAINTLRTASYRGMYGGPIRTPEEWDQEVNRIVRDKDTWQEAVEKSAYLMDLAGTDLGIDGRDYPGSAKRINASRENQPAPLNCTMVRVRFYGIDIMLVINLEQIQQDEELLMDYGDDYWKHQQTMELRYIAKGRLPKELQKIEPDKLTMYGFLKATMGDIYPRWNDKRTGIGLCGYITNTHKHPELYDPCKMQSFQYPNGEEISQRTFFKIKGYARQYLTYMGHIEREEKERQRQEDMWNKYNCKRKLPDDVSTSKRVKRSKGGLDDRVFKADGIFTAADSHFLNMSTGRNFKRRVFKRKKTSVQPQRETSEVDADVFEGFPIESRRRMNDDQ